MRYCRYIFIVIALMISCVMLAQPRLRRPEIYIGGHAGMMASSMLFNPSVTGIDIIQSPLSVNGGLVFRYAGHKVCAIQVEANYMQRGWREKGDGFDYRRQLEYIEVPLLMHLYLGGQHFRGFLNHRLVIVLTIPNMEPRIQSKPISISPSKILLIGDWLVD